MESVFEMILLRGVCVKVKKHHQKTDRIFVHSFLSTCRLVVTLNQIQLDD